MKKISLSLFALLICACNSDNGEVIDDEIIDEDQMENLSSNEFLIDEHAIEGTVIGTVSSSSSGEISYTIDSTINDIQINENTGELLVGVNTILDFETQSSLVLTVSIFNGNTIEERDITIRLRDVDEYEALSETQKEIVTYFKYLVLNEDPSSNGPDTSSRWEDPMKLFLDGNISNTYKETIEDIIAEYNGYLIDSDFNISLVETEAESNAHLFFGDQASVENIWDDVFELINGGNFAGFAVSVNRNSALSDSRIWISSELEPLTKHELGHALGFGHSNRCQNQNSFLCSTVTPNSNILDIEQEIIRLAYHTDLDRGLSDEELNQAIATILLNE